MIPNPFGFAYSDDIDIEGMASSLERLKRPEGRVDVVLDTDKMCIRDRVAGTASLV